MGTSGLCPKSCKRFGIKNVRRENLWPMIGGVWQRLHFDGKKRIFVGKEKCIIEDVLAVVTNEVMGDACRLVPLLLSLPGRRHHQPPPPPPLAPAAGWRKVLEDECNLPARASRNAPGRPQERPRRVPISRRDWPGGPGAWIPGPTRIGALRIAARQTAAPLGAGGSRRSAKRGSLDIISDRVAVWSHK